MTYHARLATFTVVCEDAGPLPSAATHREASELARAVLIREDADVEHFGILALNAKRRVIGSKLIGKGSVTSTVATPREAFRAALVLGAHTIIVFHSHPSGDPSPSESDRQLTRRLARVGDDLGVRLYDHLIIGSPGRLYSFAAAESHLWP